MQAAPKMKVYGFVTYDRSAKVTWALEELGLPYEFVRLDSDKGDHKSPEHLARHPLNAVPVLEFADGITIHESSGILWYLAERFPSGALVPDMGTKERANCIQWLFYADGSLGDSKSSRMFVAGLPDYPADAKAADGKPAQEMLKSAKERTEAYFQENLAMLEARLSANPFICGERFTVADIAIAYSLSWNELKGQLESYPALKAYIARNRARPAAVKSKAFDRS